MLFMKSTVIMSNKALLTTYRDFLLKYYDAEYPLRKKLFSDAQKLDDVLQMTWFTAFSYVWLEREAPRNWDSLERLTVAIRYSVWNSLQSHPFIQECIRLHRELFEELINE